MVDGQPLYPEHDVFYAIVPVSKSFHDKYADAWKRMIDDGKLEILIKDLDPSAEVSGLQAEAYVSL